MNGARRTDRRGYARISGGRLQQDGATAARTQLHSLERGIEPSLAASAVHLVNDPHLAADDLSFANLDASGRMVDGNGQPSPVWRLWRIRCI